MNKQQEHLFTEIKAMYTGNYAKDSLEILPKLQKKLGNEVDSEFISVVEAYFAEAYTDDYVSFDDILADINTKDDEAFIEKMRKLIQVDNSAQAQFEMSIFISKMEDEFNFTPHMDTKQLSIFELEHLFQFIVQNEGHVKLDPTERDYATIYRAYAEILFANNDWRDATDAYQQAQLWNPYDPEIHFDLAALCREMEQFGMFYTNVITGLDNSIKVEDLSRGFAYLGDFYREKRDFVVASQIYHISNAWEENELATAGLSACFAETGKIMPALEGDELDEFMDKYNINKYPAKATVKYLKVIGYQMLEAGDAEAAFTYFSLYEDIMGPIDEKITTILDELEASLAYDHDHHSH